MAVVENVIEGFVLVVQWPTILWLFVGICLGILIGALPGIGPSAGMAILAPATLVFESHTALVFLMALYLGGMYGGSIAAILINAPGTPAAAATTFDGYPLTRQGKAIDALTISALSSAMGGIISGILVLVLFQYFIDVVLLFQSPDYFIMALFGISLITVIARGAMVKGLIAGAAGVLISTVGAPPAGTFEPRFTFGQLALYDGIHFIPILIGVFAFSEIFKLAAERGSIQKETEMAGTRREGITNVFRQKVTILKSSVIGLVVGSIPGAGATISNFIAYIEEVRSSDEEGYGDGNVRGVMAAESSNNATVIGSLIPAISFGIPGSGATAILIGALLLHGIRPGPELLTVDSHIVYATFTSIIVGSLFILVLGLSVVRRLNAIVKIDIHYIIPVVIVLGTLGSLGLRNNVYDVITLFVFSVIGFYMRVYNYSLIALVLGVILGPIMEVNLLRSLEVWGTWTVFLQKPISAILLIATLFVILSPLLARSKAVILGSR